MFTTIRGYEITAGDLLDAHDGSLVEVLETWIDKGQMWMRYRCNNGDELDTVVPGGLTERRWTAER
jgi:hypothetical protein